MAQQRKAPFRSLVEPFLDSEPLFIRLCSAFVNNLAQILRVTLLIGAILLIRDFRAISDEWMHRGTDPATIEPVIASEPTISPVPQEPVVTERVRHYLNCTYKDYRTEHYGECVEEASEVYGPPQAGPDDTGYLYHERPVRLVSTLAEQPQQIDSG